MSRPKGPLTVLFNFRIEESDQAALEKQAKRLNLNESEICRRSLRIGLRALRGFEMPGTAIEPE